ncbi:putative acyl carrier protein [Pyronema domesticum]|nr:putative acyl carrier protein [Pyronema domesticum]KAI5814858.1 putative acyl carrier protein [Pyronema omphalodes]
MFRSAIVRATRAAARPAVFRPAVVPKAVFPSAIRYYSAPASLSKDEVEGRIKDLLKGFDKVQDQSKVTGTSHFTNDLGLDSLDTVEVVMAIEEEFSIEIPDKEADNIHSVDQAVNYIIAQPDAH